MSCMSDDTGTRTRAAGLLLAAALLNHGFVGMAVAEAPKAPRVPPPGPSATKEPPAQAGPASTPALPRAEVPAAVGGVDSAASAPSPKGRPARRLIADSQALVFEASHVPPPKPLADFGEEQARVIQEINRTRGTYQSYLLYTSEDLGLILFNPGATITLGPSGPRPRARRRDAATPVVEPVSKTPPSGS